MLTVSLKVEFEEPSNCAAALVMLMESKKAQS